MSIRQHIHTESRPRLLITGASTRAAAWSAVRAGFFPVCADRFTDEDLRQVAEVYELPELQMMCEAGKLQSRVCARISVTDLDPILFKSCEEALSEGTTRWPGPLLGQQGFFQRRWPLGLSRILETNGLPNLEIQVESKNTDKLQSERSGVVGGPSMNRTWLEKPVIGGGGKDVRFWNSHAAKNPLTQPTYFQEYRIGQPMSAIFLAGRRRVSPVELIGVTEQLIGDTAAAAPSQFAYCGNIAPVSVPEEAIRTLGRIGEVLAKNQHHSGLFGVDFIWDGTTPWVVETNPRYTASCELLELALGRALLRDHWQAWLPREPLPALPEAPRSRPGVIGKLILYARTAVTAPDLSRFLKPRSPWTVPFLADIPRTGTAFSPGEPMCTVFATASNPDECRQKLDRRAERVRRWFGDLVAPRGVIS